MTTFLAVYVYFADNTRNLQFIQPMPFDLERWAQRRQRALWLLGVVKVYGELVQVSDGKERS